MLKKKKFKLIFISKKHWTPIHTPSPPCSRQADGRRQPHAAPDEIFVIVLIQKLLDWGQGKSIIIIFNFSFFFKYQKEQVKRTRSAFASVNIRTSRLMFGTWNQRLVILFDFRPVNRGDIIKSYQRAPIETFLLHEKRIPSSPPSVSVLLRGII